jgi:hypothetical protein
LQESIAKAIEEKISGEQRRYLLNEQLKAIKKVKTFMIWFDWCASNPKQTCFSLISMKFYDSKSWFIASIMPVLYIPLCKLCNKILFVFLLPILG